MKKSFLLIAIAGLCLSACTKPAPVVNKHPEEPSEPTEIADDLPEPMPKEAYMPSLKGYNYLPIMVEYSSSNNRPISWKKEKTRILPYLCDFKADTTLATYTANTNKYGSSTKLPRQAVTGRFYVKQIEGRWWIVDPEGYLHYERAVTSFRKGSSERNATGWKSRFSDDADWVAKTRDELAEYGVHGTGAFCTNAYDLMLKHNAAHPDKPLTLAPSFGFLSQFKNSVGGYPGGSADNEVGLVFYPGWAEFCTSYVKSALGPYLNQPTVLGFFSDNELNFSSGSSDNNVAYLLFRLLDIKDETNPARIAAENYVRDVLKKDPKVKSKLYYADNCKFAGYAADLYYKAVKEAVTKADPQMLYLGSRLHGTPKYIQEVVEAAGRYCDIVSINYYSRWSPELDTRVKDWGTWAAKPFLVTEFYTKGINDSDLSNESGAGFAVPTQKERAYAYQHFTLGLLEAPNCVGWHWFKYQDDDGNDNSGKPANKGMYDNYYKVYPYLGKFMRNVNYNVYELTKFFGN